MCRELRPPSQPLAVGGLPDRRFVRVRMGNGGELAIRRVELRLRNCSHPLNNLRDSVKLYVIMRGT
jgi:hypothetical protein